MAQQKPQTPPALFESIFDGPDSMFGRIFGSDEPAAAPAQPDIRIKLNQKQFDRLVEGNELKYKVDGQTILLVAPAKHSREKVANLLKAGSITSEQAEKMLRMRA
jgi:hypothetical protein